MRFRSCLSTKCRWTGRAAFMGGADRARQDRTTVLASFGQNRRRVVVKARRLSCQLAVQGMGYSGAGVARFREVTT